MQASPASGQVATEVALPAASSSSAAWRKVIGAIFGAVTVLTVSTVGAAAETRTLDLYNNHTRERLTITFKKNGRYIPSALAELNRFLRDWRRNESIKMDPRLFDAVWEVYQQSGSRQPIHVVCGYRSLATNNLLRSRSSAVAKHSQHTLGKAMDLNIPDVSVDKLRAIGVKLQNGGVGWYPSANSPFVHIDVGNVRAWPRMTRNQLVQLFPDGKTAHIPADGKPLPGYKEALAEIQRKKGGGIVVDDTPSTGSRGGGLLAMLFGGEEDTSTEISAASDDGDEGAAPAVAAKPARPAPAVVAEPQQPVVVVRQQPAAPVLEPEAPATPSTLVATLAPRPLPAPERPAPEPVLTAEAPAVAAEPTPDKIPFAVAIAPLPLARPDEISGNVVLASLDVPAVLPPIKPSIMPEPAAPAVPEPALAMAAPLPRPAAADLHGRDDAIAAQLALAEVAKATPPAPAAVQPAEALAYAAPVAPAPAAAAPAAAQQPIRTASLMPAGQPAALVRGLGRPGSDSLSALPEAKGDMLGGIEAPLVVSEDGDALLDGSQSVYWGHFTTLTHPDQRNIAQYFAPPVAVTAVTFGKHAYEGLVSTRFTGSVTPPSEILDYLPRNKLAMR